MAGAETEAHEDIFTTVPQVAPASGLPMPAFRQFRVTKKMADIRYGRGMARPAAEVYLERLRAMGVVAIKVLPDAEESVRVAAARMGITVQGARPRGE